MFQTKNQRRCNIQSNFPCLVPSIGKRSVSLPPHFLPIMETIKLRLGKVREDLKDVLSKEKRKTFDKTIVESLRINSEKVSICISRARSFFKENDYHLKMIEVVFSSFSSNAKRLIFFVRRIRSFSMMYYIPSEELNHTMNEINGCVKEMENEQQEIESIISNMNGGCVISQVFTSRKIKSSSSRRRRKRRKSIHRPSSTTQPELMKIRSAKVFFKPCFVNTQKKTMFKTLGRKTNSVPNIRRCKEKKLRKRRASICSSQEIFRARRNLSLRSALSTCNSFKGKLPSIQKKKTPSLSKKKVVKKLKTINDLPSVENFSINNISPWDIL